jgi:hypothetical protein
MDSQNTPMGDGMDWNDPMFNTSEQFVDNMNSDSPFTNAFESYTNMNDFAESPGGLQMRHTSKPAHDVYNSFASGVQQQQQQPHPMAMPNFPSVETSSQDSSSDTSSGRKRKTASESPISEVDRAGNVKKEDSLLGMDAQKMQLFGANGNNHKQMQGMNIQTSMADNSIFDFSGASSTSSPINATTFDTAMSLDSQMQVAMQNMPQQFKQESPVRPGSQLGAATQQLTSSQVQTINPADFSLGGASRDQSPSMMNAPMFNNSPSAVFSTPSSESNETFTATADASFNIPQNPAWNANYGNQFNSPGNLHFTPSPAMNGATPSAQPKASGGPRGRSLLHIAPISTKSRVETQINVVMTLEKPPPNTEYLHLPLHTIAKSKLLAKEEVDKSKSLELHTMLVCTSAMRNPELKEKALQNAASQDNNAIQRRAEQQKDAGEEDKNDLKNIPEEDRPSNGGEVRICNNCIQRERKRAGRKKLKKEEEQQHWERYETERVVVFNSNEFLSFKPWEAGQQQQKDHGLTDDYIPPDGSMHVTAAMRIACYCRHQSEKEGFQVIFTMKDQAGNMIAQEMSDSILITDDHKTHPPSFSTHVPEQMLYGGGGPVYPTHGLPTSYSMIDMAGHVQQGFTSSRSAGNLQALQFSQYPQSHVHQLPNQGYVSQTTSGTMTPTSLSRPASPTSAGSSGPNKKRKSSSFHRKVPSGLTMTPRVDTNQSQGQTMNSAISMGTPFSPTGTGFTQQADQSYMTIPNNNGPAQYISSGPPTPAENAPFAFNQQTSGPPRRDAPPNIPDYYQSLPGSRVGSRAPSPVAGSRANLAAYARQQMAPSQPPPRSQAYPPQQGPVPGSSGSDADTSVLPMIHKLTPSEGPTTGGTEVSIYGRNFTSGCLVYFGEQLATGLTFYGDQSLLCVTPPGRVGAVHVTIVQAGNMPQYSPSQTSRPIFNYKNSNERMMEMALRFLSQQHTGNANGWYQMAQHSATQFMSQNVSRAGVGPGYDGGNMLSTGPAMLEDSILRIFEAVDMSETLQHELYDVASEDGETMLTLAAANGLHRVVAALLARGANPDVRDGSGYTALLHAALQGHLKMFQLLLVRGADPAIRSLAGCTAIDLAPEDARGAFGQILLSTPRTRIPLRPRRSTESSSSSASWDISSASYYESEVDANSSQQYPSQPPSRRPSEQLTVPTASVEQITVDPATDVSSPIASMYAWRDALAAQIQHFQSSVQAHMPQFPVQLPPLPTVPEDTLLGRRINSLIPGRTSSPPPSAESCPPPPSYSELFPEKSLPPKSNANEQEDGGRAVDVQAEEKSSVDAEKQSTFVMKSKPAASSEYKLQSRISELADTPAWLWVSRHTSAENQT